MTDGVVSDITDVSDAETGLALQIGVAVVLSLETGVSSLSTPLFKQQWFLLLCLVVLLLIAERYSRIWL